MNQVINFGSLNIDYVYRVDHMNRRGETQMAKERHIYSGGKGLNQSVALARAGAAVHHAGCIGQEGRFLLQELSEAGADVRNVRILEDIPSGHTIIQNDRDGDNSILLFGGANQCVTRAQADAALAGFDEGDWAVLQNEISEVAYIMEKAHEKGMTIVFNPSPADESVNAYPLAFVDWFLLNEIEAAMLTGSASHDYEELLKALSEKYPGAKIVLTLGSKGALYTDGKEILVQKAFPVRALDTTAAGDTFTGYFIAEMIRSGSVPEALRLAAKAAAVAVTRAGAAPSIPKREECI